MSIPSLSPGVSRWSSSSQSARHQARVRASACDDESKCDVAVARCLECCAGQGKYKCMMDNNCEIPEGWCKNNRCPMPPS